MNPAAYPFDSDPSQCFSRLAGSGTMWAAMIVDVHSHIWPLPHQMVPTAVPLLEAAGAQPWQRLDASAATHSRAAENVQMSIVHGLRSVHAGVEVSHEQVAAAVAQHADAGVGAAGIDPMPGDADASIDEAKMRNLAAVTISPAGQAMHPQHSRAMKVYERCQHERLAVFVHGPRLFGDKAVLEFARPELYDAVATEFADLRLVITQIGRPWVEPTLSLISKHPHVYADVAGLVEQPWFLYQALLAAGQYGAMDKLLLGSGFPLCTPRQAIHNLYSINTMLQGTNLPTIPRQQLRGIVERDAFACLGIEPKHEMGDAAEAGPDDAGDAEAQGAGADGGDTGKAMQTGDPGEDVAAADLVEKQAP